MYHNSMLVMVATGIWFRAVLWLRSVPYYVNGYQNHFIPGFGLVILCNVQIMPFRLHHNSFQYVSAISGQGHFPVYVHNGSYMIR